VRNREDVNGGESLSVAFAVLGSHSLAKKNDATLAARP
jgi:hypothetical protein